jgi:hypothetical protein
MILYLVFQILSVNEVKKNEQESTMIWNDVRNPADLKYEAAVGDPPLYSSTTYHASLNLHHMAFCVVVAILVVLLSGEGGGGPGTLQCII